ncbi:hypothetical protein C8R47DRAFT_1205479 [Mycena vitilis]|nr:hypothetical protein C8R47DRAFT_1205479 [Mycena vitilis]
MTEAEFWTPDSHFRQDRAFCEEVLKLALRPEQIGVIRHPAYWTHCPPEDHPLVKIFESAMVPLTALLKCFSDDHPVVLSYNSFFMDAPEGDRDARVQEWLQTFLADPTPELTALMQRPLKKLEDFRVLAVPGRERHYRVIGVGQAMLQILALQHELEEPLDLNGDMFEDLVDKDIFPVTMQAHHAIYAMFRAKNPKQLRHKRHWDSSSFNKAAKQFSNTHAIVDPNYHPATYLRPGSRESRRPRVAVETFPIAEEVTGEGSNNAQQVEDPRNKIRRRSDDEDADADADVPLPKRQATQRRLRSRDKKRVVEPRTVTGKVVARGKGWITVESGTDDK